jgi:hypothetical protein
MPRFLHELDDIIHNLHLAQQKRDCASEPSFYTSLGFRFQENVIFWIVNLYRTQEGLDLGSQHGCVEIVCQVISQLVQL